MRTSRVGCGRGRRNLSASHRSVGVHPAASSSARDAMPPCRRIAGSMFHPTATLGCSRTRPCARAHAGRPVVDCTRGSSWGGASPRGPSPLSLGRCRRAGRATHAPRGPCGARQVAGPARWPSRPGGGRNRGATSALCELRKFAKPARDLPQFAESPRRPTGKGRRAGEVAGMSGKVGPARREGRCRVGSGRADAVPGRHGRPDRDPAARCSHARRADRRASRPAH